MNYRIETTPAFDRAVKRLLKKYRHIKADLLILLATSWGATRMQA
jgi:mRNA-degrading endonuclease RelE of RelBE toxin-antitoxin system